MKRLLLLVALLPMLAACDEMAAQPRDSVYGASALFKNGQAMQTPPQGVIAQEDPAYTNALAVRPEMTKALIERGRERYNIYCVVCHDPAGYGQGEVPSRGFPYPPSFHSARLMAAPPEHFVQVITYGYGVMYSYADRVPPADRWAIAAYIQALQLSQAAPAAELTAADRAHLEGADGR